MAGTAQADGIGLPVMTIHPPASTSYPKELVNGDFQTFGNQIVDKRSGGWQYLSFVDGNGMAMEGSSERPWAKVDGWDAVKFGWKSNDSVSGHSGIVEVQRFRTAVKGSTGNVWGEIAAATQGKYLYQDIDTANTSDAMYTVRLKHASRNKDARDSMQVLVGAPGREKPVTMRRTIANAGDKAGEESTTITSTGTGQDDQWDTYEGTVLVPRGQDVTRFTFKSVADSNSAGRPDSAEGNLIDDVVFTKAYQLTYDANGGVKTRTSQIDYTTGGETRGKVKTVRDSPAPPAGQEKIVNGDFEYSGTGAGLSDSPFNYVSLSRKSYYYKDSRNVNHRVALPAGFDAKRFAWKSDQTGKDLGNPPYEQAGDVQVWNRYDGSNHYAELTAAQAGSAIYQDIDTESDSDVQYIVSLRHTSLNASHLDSMQVLIGAPGHETPVTMTRVTANGYGDKVGESSDTIATRVSNPKPADREDSDHTGQWETYTGTVTVPAGRPVTRFTFRNVSSKSAWNGNLIDDIAFTKARRLDYDANGGTKAQASQIGYRTDATQGAVETVASKTLPTELVNGSFDYLLDGGWDTISPVGRGGYADDRGWGRYTSVDTASGEYIQNAGQNPATFDSTGKWVKWPGFDAAKFGWASDQKGGQPQGGVGLTDRPNAVELQQDSVTGNTYAEIVGSETGKAILQKIDTQHDSDTVYTVRFDHASLSKEHADSMQALVNGKPVTMTRVTSNKAGDEQGWTGTSITTHATNTNRFQHDGQWATYEGTVTIPANTPVSTFTFKALNAVDPTKGNLIDNLTFKIAYRLSYDANVRTEIVMPARAKTVYALWAINPTLSYNVNAPAGSNAPGTPASQTVPYNTAAADKSGWAAGDTGKIPGYRFDGWYTAPNGGNKYDFNTPLTGNVTVYAHWVGNGYTVRFAGNGATGGGTPDQAFQYNIGQNLHRNGFVRDGYTFTGWKRADNQQAYGDGQWVTNLTTQPNGIVTLVAQWSANEAHIRYNPNPPAGKTTGGQGTPNWDGHTGDTPTIGQNGWTIDGYTFAGWATSPDGSGARYAPGARWTANGTLTLYAQWTPGQASLTYDGNGATGGKTDPQTGKTDEKINVRDNGFTRDGYTFVTWNTQADCKGNAVKPNSEWTLRGSSTLYACWAGNAQTLTYHGNGATGGNTAAQSGKTGDELTTNANGFTRDGYTFVRWDTAKDGSGTAYGEGKNGVSQYVMKPAGNDLYAIWKANPATIQYRNDWPNTTGSTPDTTGNTGDTVTISQNSFDRPGYTFTGWSTSKRGDPSLQPGDKHTLEPRTTTVWAQWKADPAHLVYNSNIGTVGSETKTVDGVVDQTVKTITNPFDRPGYTFSGWNTQADGKGKAYATGADYVLTANDKSTPKNTSVLYAQWKINGASLKFNPNGGIGHVDDVTGDAFSTVTIPGDAKEPKITRPGYRFVGWSTEKNPPAGSTFLQPGEGKVTLPAEGSTTVYAQWEPSLTTLPFTGGQAQVPTIWLYAGFALMLIALGVMMPMLRMRMGAGSKGRHAGTPTIGRHSR